MGEMRAVVQFVILGDSREYPAEVGEATGRGKARRLSICHPERPKEGGISFCGLSEPWLAMREIPQFLRNDMLGEMRAVLQFVILSDGREYPAEAGEAKDIVLCAHRFAIAARS